MRDVGVQDMSAEVVDSNPYSRLMALQRMGIVENYERIREFSVAIVVCTCLPLCWFLFTCKYDKLPIYNASVMMFSAVGK